jgi:predicted transcriptional regulator
VHDYAAGKADWSASGLPVEGRSTETPRAGDLAARDVPVCAVDDPAAEVLKMLRGSGWDTAIVLGCERVVLGRLYEDKLTEAIERDPTVKVEGVMDPGPSTFRPDVARKELREFLREHELGTAVITTHEGELVGVVRREDLEPAAGP